MIWQPIATAPNDQRVLLFFPAIGSTECRIECGRWKEDKSAKKSRPYWTGDAEQLWGIRFYRDLQPTHWMSLPEPPNENPSADPQEDRR